MMLALRRVAAGAAVVGAAARAPMSTAHSRIGIAESRATKAAEAARLRREFAAPTTQVVMPAGADNHPKIRAHREAL
jgi:hypothetical protein